MYEVYLITNKINGKMYVGITKRGYKSRFVEHISSAACGSKTILHNAIRKYGKENFDLSLLESDVDESIIGERERYYIALYNTYYKYRKGYNMTIGGNGTIGYQFTDEVKHRMSLANTGRKYSKERNEKIRKAMLGREYLPEWRTALSKARMGKYGGKSNPFYGKQHNAKTKSKISNANSKYTIYQFDKETGSVLREFKNSMDAGRWVVDNGYSKAKPDTCVTRILLVCRSENPNCTAYGFKWRLKEKSID